LQVRKRRKFYTLDHRRLYAFREGLKGGGAKQVVVQLLSLKEPAVKKEFLWKLNRLPRPPVGGIELERAAVSTPSKGKSLGLGSPDGDDLGGNGGFWEAGSWCRRQGRGGKEQEQAFTPGGRTTLVPRGLPHVGESDDDGDAEFLAWGTGRMGERWKRATTARGVPTFEFPTTDDGDDDDDDGDNDDNDDNDGDDAQVGQQARGVAAAAGRRLLDKLVAQPSPPSLSKTARHREQGQAASFPQPNFAAPSEAEAMQGKPVAVAGQLVAHDQEQEQEQEQQEQQQEQEQEQQQQQELEQRVAQLGQEQLKQAPSSAARGTGRGGRSASKARGTGRGGRGTSPKAAGLEKLDQRVAQLEAEVSPGAEDLGPCTHLSTSPHGLQTNIVQGWPKLRNLAIHLD
jgi:hypothetical protein